MGYRLQPVEPMSGRPLGPAIERETPPPPAPPLAPEPERAEQPYPAEGTVDDVLAWVGYDPDRAKAATAAEYDRGKPRKTLLRELSERTG